MRIDLTGRVVLVTGGTRGLGRAIALSFARAGAQTVVTHRWGSVPDDEVRTAFTDRGLLPPVVIESDAGDLEDVRALMQQLAALEMPVHTLISNVAMGKVTKGLADLKKASLDLSLQYTAWPVVDLVQAASEVLGRVPRYVIAISSDGTELCHEGYDLIGASKSTLETLCRYLAVRLKRQGVRVNVVRPGALDTASAEATFGSPAIDGARATLSDVWIDPERVGDAVLALCSGLLDAVTGQVLVVDEGWSLVSPLTLNAPREPFTFPDHGQED